MRWHPATPFNSMLPFSVYDHVVAIAHSRFTARYSNQHHWLVSYRIFTFSDRNVLVASATEYEPAVCLPLPSALDSTSSHRCARLQSYNARIPVFSKGIGSDQRSLEFLVKRWKRPCLTKCDRREMESQTVINKRRHLGCQSTLATMGGDR